MPTNNLCHTWFQQIGELRQPGAYTSKNEEKHL